MHQRHFSILLLALVCGSMLGCGGGGGNPLPQINLPPVITSVVAGAPSGPFAPPNVTVTYTATATDDGGAAGLTYAWDTNGDNVFDNGTGNPLTATYTTDGNYTATVKVTDSGTGPLFATMSSAVVNIPAPAAPAWTVMTADAHANDVGQWSSLVLLANNFPAIAYYDATDGDLEFASATVANPTTTAQWNVPVAPVHGDSAPAGLDIGQGCSMALVDGSSKPAISYYDAVSGALMYAHGTTVAGAPWTVLAIPPDPGAGFSPDPRNQTSLLSVGGFPAIAYNHSTDGLKYAVSSDPAGINNTWAATLPMQVDALNAPEAGGYCSLALINGKPGISYFDDAIGVDNLKFALCDSAAPTSSTNWSQTATSGATFVDQGSGVEGQFTSLIALGDMRPAISYYVQNSGDLWYAFGSQVAAVSQTNWNTATNLVPVDTGGDVGQYTSMALVGNGSATPAVPGICYYDATNLDLKYSSSSSAVGGAGTWTTQTVPNVGDCGKYTSMVVLPNGKPAVSYYDETNGNLMYAYLN